jgi:hypothetical protein
MQQNISHIYKTIDIYTSTGSVLGKKPGDLQFAILKIIKLLIQGEYCTLILRL